MTIHDPRYWTGLIQFYSLISDPVLSPNTDYLLWTLAITHFRFLEMVTDDLVSLYCAILGFYFRRGLDATHTHSH